MKKSAILVSIIALIFLLNSNPTFADHPNLTPTPTPDLFARYQESSLASPTPTPVYIATGGNPTPTCTELSECDSDNDGFSDDTDPNPYVCNPCRKANNWELDADYLINPPTVSWQPYTSHFFQLYWDYSGSPSCNFPASCGSIDWVVSGGAPGVDYSFLYIDYDMAEIVFYNSGNYHVISTHNGWCGCDPIYGGCSTSYTSASGGSDSISVTILGLTPTPTPVPDNCSISVYVQDGNPFMDFPGHAFFKLNIEPTPPQDYPSGDFYPYNNHKIGWWPQNGFFLGDTGVWIYELVKPEWGIDVQKSIACNRLEAIPALSWLYSQINNNKQYNVVTFNCVHTSKSVFSFGYDDPIPYTTSLWALGVTETPEGWGNWLESHIP